MQLSGIETTALSSADVMYAIEQELSPIKSILQDCFNRVETKASALSYFQGLISTDVVWAKAQRFSSRFLDPANTSRDVERGATTII